MKTELAVLDSAMLRESGDREEQCTCLDLRPEQPRSSRAAAAGRLLRESV
jgi:hypothetical protein